MKKDQLFDSLKRVPLLSDLSRKELERVASDGREEVYSPGQDIVTEGDSGGPFFMLLEGRAEILKGGKSRRTLEPGAYFGEMSLIDHKPRSATVRAETNVKGLAIPSYSFMALLEDNFGLAKKVMAHLSNRVRELDDNANN